MIKAEVQIINSKNEIIELFKEFSGYRDAESWIMSFWDNPRCVFAGCPTLAFSRIN